MQFSARAAGEGAGQYMCVGGIKPGRGERRNQTGRGDGVERASEGEGG